MVLPGIAEKIAAPPHALIGNRGLHSALSQLIYADACAQSAQCNPWEFALEIECLISGGLTNSDLRWLIRKGYLAHAYEVTRACDKARKFQSCRNLAFAKRTCFVLTEAGARLAKTPNLQPRSFPVMQSAAANRISGDNIDHIQNVPCWDADRRILRMDCCIVKQFKVPSPCQEAILTAFEEDGWPAGVDDPLPPQAQQDPKRRLRNTIQSLNANQKSPLIHFRGDGSGQRILWELTPGRAEHLKIKGQGAIRAA